MIDVGVIHYVTVGGEEVCGNICLYLNEGKDLEIKRHHRQQIKQKRHKSRHLKLKTTLPWQIALHLHAWSPTHRYMTACVPLHQQVNAYLLVVCVGLF